MKPKRPVGKKACGCINHNIFCPPSSNVSLRGRSYFERRADFRELLRWCLVDRRVIHICTGCLDYGKRKIAERHTGNNTTSDRADDDLSTDETDETEDNENEINPPGYTDETFLELDAGSNTADQTVPENDTVCTLVADRVCDEDDNDGTVEGFADVVRADTGAGVEETVNDTVEEIKRMTARLRGFKSWRYLDNDVKDSLCELSLVLGSLINKELDNERFEMAHQCRDFPTLISIKQHEWYQQRNPLLTNFLHGCTGVSPNTTKKKKLNSAIHAIEQIMYTKNNNIVTPFALQRNIIIYMVSHSKIGYSRFYYN